jgi:hypothetical protein
MHRLAHASALTATALLVAALSLQAAALSLDETGVKVDQGAMGTFHLDYPVLYGGNSQPVHKKLRADATGKTATVTYEGGASVVVDISHLDQINYTFDSVPDDVKIFRCGMLIDFSFAQGGKWKMGAGADTPFPADKPANPHLYQGNTTRMQLTDASGSTIVFRVPDYSYQELNDNRAWNWPIFAWFFAAPYNPDSRVYTVLTSDAPGVVAAPARRTPLIDEFGQLKAQDWPGKVKSADELTADVKSEADYYASLSSPTLDKYGGLPGIGDKYGLKATGFFHLERKAKWLLVDPAGNAFFHLGVCAFQPGDDYTWVGGRQDIYEWLPPLESAYKTAYLAENGSNVFSFYIANTIRKYGKAYDLGEYQARMVPRVRKFGFNSIGAFSASSAAARAANFPYVSGLPLDPWTGKIRYIPGVNETWDPFDEKNRAQVEINFAKALPPRKDDPLLIGYFLTNEPLYEDIPKVVPTLKGSEWACKHALVQMLHDKYKTIDAFHQAWGTPAASFDELEDKPLAVTTQAAFEDMHAYTGLFFETYFKLVADTFHQYDPNHMLIGNRFQPGTINNEQLCRIAGKYLDVMSFNYYTDAVDKDFLGRIYKWTGRPMFLSEFYWTAPRESGLLGGSDLPTQQGRGLAYRNYVEQTAAMDFIVGIEWFTLIDQAATGRWFSKYNGERANTGLFSVADRPYKPMLEEMKKTNDAIYDVWLGGKTPYLFDNPRFSLAGGNSNRMASVLHALGPVALDGTTRNWPGVPPETMSGKRLVFGSDAHGLEGTFKVCWDESNLYLLATVIDPTPMKNTQTGGNVWSGDGVEVFLGSEKVDEGGELLFSDRHLMIGAGGPGSAPYYFANSLQQYECHTVVVPGSDGKSYTLEAAIPWNALGTQPHAGQELLFDVAFNNSDDGTGRNAQLMWNGTAKNSGDRTHWGHAKLLP